MEKIIEFVVTNIWGFIVGIFSMILQYFYKDVAKFRSIIEELEKLLPPKKDMSKKIKLSNIPIDCTKLGTLKTKTTFDDLDLILKKLEVFDNDVNFIFPLKKEVLDASENLQYILNNHPIISKKEVSINTYTLKIKSIDVSDVEKELEITIVKLIHIIDNIHRDISYREWLVKMLFLRKLKREYIDFIKPYISILFKKYNYDIIQQSDDNLIIINNERNDLISVKKIRYVNEVITIIFLVILILIFLFGN